MIVHFISKYLGIFLIFLVIILAIFVYADFKIEQVYLKAQINTATENIIELEALNTAYRQMTVFQLENDIISVDELHLFLPGAEVLQIKHHLSRETIQ